MIAWQVIFFFSLLLIFHSYVLFPLILAILSSGKKQNTDIYQKDNDNLPRISVILAAFNEAKVIRKKILSTFETGYPAGKIQLLIGSDASTDQTNEIVRSMEADYPGLKLVEFSSRSGKAKIINELAAMASNEILVLTDANVFFTPVTLYQLVKHYRNPEICLVGGNIINYGESRDGISFQEKAYISRENRIKYMEGVIWGTMIGAFGGCYSIRKNYYAPVPPRFFMDDFYITMNVLENKGKSINELEAVCKEDVSNIIGEEFRRKIRISIGNFQNLARYRKLLLPLFSGLSFSFLSHKVIRWFCPFLLLLVFLANGFLFGTGLFYKITFFIQLFLFLIPLFDAVLRNMKVHLTLLRFISHFYLMNLALLIGFFRFTGGVKSNIWQPTQRFQ